ncbi:MAG: hypothetical protein KDH99_12630 [Alcanivoracaceae bacterium]|nr:hypothetical protein [Alcanivoracaceae bacterium]
MDRTKAQLLAFKVRQGVGSMAIEGIQVSRKSQADMLRIASGRVSARSVKDQLIDKYRQEPAAD